MKLDEMSNQEIAAQGLTLLNGVDEDIAEMETKVSTGVGPDLRDILGTLRLRMLSLGASLAHIERRMRLPDTQGLVLHDELRSRVLTAAYIAFASDLAANGGSPSPTRAEFDEAWNSMIADAVADPREEEAADDIPPEAHDNLAGLFVAFANAEMGTEETPGERAAGNEATQ